MNTVRDSSTVSTMRSRFARSDEPVSVISTMASASCGTFTSVAPQENSTRAFTPWRARYFFVRFTTSVAITLPSRSLRRLHRRLFGHRQHPAHRRQALLGVEQFGDLRHVRARLQHPVAAGDAGVERARFHVARHLLRAHQHAGDFRIVDGGKVAARTYRDAPSGARKQLQRGILQAALGQAQSQAASSAYFPSP